ncbi:hypothetical protein D8674_017342 [Pyrus ussuriensis x Pyrus communis]|uniref:Uncharacterized protein n=1 Tax=Pyrus ussuriensis x Pyrus communis TaxID=2448454 RepID=A0A5N5HHU9_9ROSA|nr:uncharacterized protein LOC103948725 [Pyrus x bretschneideri]KAB2625682.1 hypothetical protein D8674_017342 [Pyrus ussuriensis x Pyrus communis]
MSFQQNHGRRILPPVPSRKRKESSSNGFKQPAPKAPKAPITTTFPKAPSKSSAPKASSKSSAPKASSKTTSSAPSSNRLLAGYMAYEYLTKGTLFGQKLDPAGEEAVPLAGKPIESGQGAGTGAAQESYSEVASLLKTDGAHIPGIVNPTQLAKWIQM